MALAVTHVLLAIILVDLFRDYAVKDKKKYFSLHTILIAGIAGLLPDIDVPLNMLLGLLKIPSGLFEHGGITHSIFFGFIFLIPAFLLFRNKTQKLSTMFFVTTFGIWLHIALDYFLGGGGYYGPMLFFPLSVQQFRLGLLTSISPQATMSLDAIILILWLWHEEVKHKIKDFI